MSAKHRKNEVTRTTIHRVYRVGEKMRQAVSARRRALGLTVRAFLAEAVEGELPGLVEALRAHLPAPEEGALVFQSIVGVRMALLLQALLERPSENSPPLEVEAADSCTNCLARLPPVVTIQL